jgi:hypothetical protein
MPRFVENIANAIKIKEIFRGRRDGCVETAVAALGGDVERIGFLSRQKIDGRLPIPVNENIVEFAGLAIRRSYVVGDDKSKTVTIVEEELNDSKNLGVLVVYDGAESRHAAAIIHRRNYPGNINTGTHVVVDTGGDRETLSMDTVERMLRPRSGHEPEKVLVIGNKKS